MTAARSSSAVWLGRLGSAVTDYHLSTYLAALAALAVYCLVRAPIVAFDTDLWYHLSHGRYLFENGQIPDTSYFSFLEPARVWVDYYWLFQALVYGIFSLTGYGGLLALRAALFAALLALVGALLLRRHETRGPPAWGAFIFVLFLVQALQRYTLVRPHTISIVAIALFLAVLEMWPRRAYVLPGVAVLWVNVHGVEYPVLMLICIAYILEIFVRRMRRGTTFERSEMKQLVALAGSMIAVFATPHGSSILSVPFTSTRLASLYINELSKPTLEQLLNFSLTSPRLSEIAAFNLLLLVALGCAAGSLARGSLRASHALLLAGGLVLLTKANRFHIEFALLSLPLIRSFGPLFTVKIGHRFVKAMAIGLLMLMPWAALRQHFPDHSEAYPLSLRNLPHGVTAFLDHVGARGTVVNPANFGGYLAWSLYPDSRIYMDMEIPFLFEDDDLYRLSAAFTDPEALRKLVERYRPAFIAGPLAPADFRELIAAHPDYEPVCFDDLVVLYADGRRFPELVTRFRLTVVDPYALAEQRLSLASGDELEAILRELNRISSIDPHIVSINLASAIIHNLRGRHDQALVAVARAISHAPQRARSHAVKADALRGLGRREEAVAAYIRALEWTSSDSDHREISRSLASCYLDLGRDRDSYRALVDAVGEFNPGVSFADAYNLGVLAARLGDASEAKRWFGRAALKVPPEEAEWKLRIEENLASFEAPVRQ